VLQGEQWAFLGGAGVASLHARLAGVISADDGVIASNAMGVIHADRLSESTSSDLANTSRTV
jgi:hypothetical protein